MGSNIINILKHPVKSRMFLFYKLPSAFFSGVRVRELDEQHCSVSVPFKWFSQNPFRSTYFACLAMAAEMSTGVLAMIHVNKLDPSGSMLVVSMHAEYFKKAKDITVFTCSQGDEMKRLIESAFQKGEASTFTAISTGVNRNGEEVARFSVTWSFKFKKQAL